MNRVHPVGLALMALSAALLVLAGRIAERFPEEKRENGKLAVKLGAMAVCMAGFLIALLAG